MEKEIHRRTQAGAIAWRKVEEVVEAKRKVAWLMHNTSLPIWPRDHGLGIMA